MTGAVDKTSFTKEVCDAKGRQIGWAIHCGEDISFVPVPSGYQEYADEEDGKINAAAGAASRARSSSRSQAEPSKSSPRPQSLKPATPNKIYEAQGKKKAGAREPIIDPETCEHRTEWLSTKGSNQYYDKVRCDACGRVLRKDATEWWSLEQEKRRIKKYHESRAKEVAKTTTRSTATPTADELREIRSGSARHAPS